MTTIKELGIAVQETEDWIDELMQRLCWHDRERTHLALLATLHPLRDCLGRDEAVCGRTASAASARAIL
jgi:uncharacterized protein (DUF2267 family)